MIVYAIAIVLGMLQAVYENSSVDGVWCGVGHIVYCATLVDTQACLDIVVVACF